ncbi:MAG: SAM-dependent methyltransferase [Pseudomonadota bacterium]
MSDHSPAQADNVTMSSGGLYSLATKGAKDVIDKATPQVLEAIDRMNPEPELSEFHMVDMGCADGGTSLQMVEAVIQKVRQAGTETPIRVTYSDQPRNDFNALVGIIHGISDFDTYLNRHNNVFPSCSGASFYLQGVPDLSVDLGFSATAMHWLSRKPCDIANHVHMVGASKSELQVFAEQARTDWETILLCRARELKPGGRLVLVNFCIDPDGQYLGNTGGINMFDTFHSNWSQMLDQKRISQHEYARMTLPQYYNTIEEFSEPLVDTDSRCYRAGLRLEKIQTAVVRCPFAAEFESDNDTKNFADGLIPTIRSWNESTFLGALDPARPTDERNQLIEDYYELYRQQVLDDPSGHGMDYVHAYMTIARV